MLEVWLARSPQQLPGIDETKAAGYDSKATNAEKMSENMAVRTVGNTDYKAVGKQFPEFKSKKKLTFR